MTVQEAKAKEVLNNIWDFADAQDEEKGDVVDDAIIEAIGCMEEVEQYRALGTVEELKEAREKQVEQVSRIDKKFAKIGFVKVQDDKYGVCYERENKTHKFTQVLYIGHKKSGRHIIQSYDKNLHDTNGIGNTCVGLSYYETKLALKKMKKKGWGK